MTRVVRLAGSQYFWQIDGIFGRYLDQDTVLCVIMTDRTPLPIFHCCRPRDGRGRTHVLKRLPASLSSISKISVDGTVASTLRLYVMSTTYHRDMEESHTPLRVHVTSYLTASESINVIDFAEERLRRLVVALVDVKKREALRRVLADYRRGRIALGWSKGDPVVMPVGPGIS